MDISRYFLCFALYSFVGWAYETIFYTVQQKKIVNSGFLNGCWCPIYGIGAFLISGFLGNIENPVKLFFMGMVLTCTLEYAVSWVLEKLFNKRWWDYTGWPLNINGRVCLIGGIAFGTFAVLFIKYLYPFTTDLMISLNNRTVYMLAALVAAAMIFDLFLTLKDMDKSDEKLWYVHEQEKSFEEFKGVIIEKIRNTIHR